MFSSWEMSLFCILRVIFDHFRDTYYYRRGVAGFGCADRVERSVMALHPYCPFLSGLILVQFVGMGLRFQVTVRLVIGNVVFVLLLLVAGLLSRSVVTVELCRVW
jgi:hypothetical protein